MPKIPPARRQALERVQRLAAKQGNVVTRHQVYLRGMTRWMVRAQVDGGRWQIVTDQVLAVHNADLTRESHLWAAVLHAGRRALLDGAAALEAEGLVNFSVERIRVSVPKGTRVRRTRAYDVRETRRWADTDRAPSGIPRTRPEVAGVRGFLWSATDKQAITLLTMTVQQGLTTSERVGRESLRIQRDKRRKLLHQIVLGLIDGARALGEHEMADLLSARGLPLPSRQVLRRGRNQRYYLDLYWHDYRVVVEIDGIQHVWVQNVVADALRHNAVVLDGDTLLRVPMLGLRLEPDAFLDQIELALRDGGWSGPPTDLTRAA